MPDHALSQQILKLNSTFPRSARVDHARRPRRPRLRRHHLKPHTATRPQGDAYSIANAQSARGELQKFNHLGMSETQICQTSYPDVITPHRQRPRIAERPSRELKVAEDHVYTCASE